MFNKLKVLKDQSSATGVDTSPTAMTDSVDTPSAPAAEAGVSVLSRVPTEPKGGWKNTPNVEAPTKVKYTAVCRSLAQDRKKTSDYVIDAPSARACVVDAEYPSGPQRLVMYTWTETSTVDPNAVFGGAPSSGPSTISFQSRDYLRMWGDGIGDYSGEKFSLSGTTLSISGNVFDVDFDCK